MVCPLGCGRGSARAGSAAVGHSRLLAGATKEVEKREEDVSVLGLEGGKGGGGQEVVGQVARAKLLVGGQLPTTGGAGPGSQRLWERASFSP